MCEELFRFAGKAEPGIQMRGEHAAMEIKTFQQWRESGVNMSVYLQPGDVIDEAFADYLSSVVSPKTSTKDLIQCGEEAGSAFSEDLRGADYLYDTCKRENGHWIFCVQCFENETLHREHDPFAQVKDILENWSLESLKEHIEFERETFENSWYGKERSGRNYEADCRYIKALTSYYHWRMEQDG